MRECYINGRTMILKLIKAKSERAYKRNIEYMGNGLILFEIFALSKSTNANFHVLYENGWKPPLDVAINVETSFIEYISFFAQDEKINEDKISNVINFIDLNVIIKDNEFSNNNFYKSIYKKYSINYLDNDIILIFKDIQKDLIAYQINENNYLLGVNGNEIVGVIMKNIKPEELENLKLAMVI